MKEPLSPEGLEELRRVIAQTLDKYRPDGGAGVLCIVVPDDGSVMQFTTNLAPEGVMFACTQMRMRAEQMADEDYESPPTKELQ